MELSKAPRSVPLMEGAAGCVGTSLHGRGRGAGGGGAGGGAGIGDVAFPVQNEIEILTQHDQHYLHNALMHL